MGTIVERKTKSGAIRYRAIIRYNRADISYTQTRTFSKKSLATAWLKKREAEIEANPQIIFVEKQQTITLADVIENYCNTVGDSFGRSWRADLRMIASLPIGKKAADKLTQKDFADFANARLNGLYHGFKAIQPQTLQANFVAIRAALKHAEFVMGLTIARDDFEKVSRGLKHARKLTASKKRTRLPTSTELEQLYHFFLRKRKTSSRFKTDMHLILWFAIYSARRESEIARLRWGDLHGDWWLVRDMKNPDGSAGNHRHFLVTDKLREVLAHCERKGETVFECSAKVICQHFSDACKMLGIDDLHFHDLRHESATRLAEQGLSIPQIQQITCHESWSSLQRYVNIKPRSKTLDFSDL